MEFDVHKLKQYEDLDDSLRDYQKENKKHVYDAWCECQSVMLQMPTGTGKTRLFVSIIKDIFHYSRDVKQAFKVLVLVHRTELVEQIDEQLSDYGLAHGIIQSGDKERKKYPVQVASVQTLSRRLLNWTDKEFDCIIVDEAHHVTAESYLKIIKAFPKAKLLGVTATPVRLNGEGFTQIFDKLIISLGIKWFIDNNYLSKYDYYSVGKSSFIQKEIDGIKKFSQGDYAESELERVCDNDRIRAQVVKTYLDHANGKKGIVYTINKLHNKNLCEKFKEQGITTVAIDSDTPKEIREKYIEQFKEGKIKIICNINLFTEGFDCPDIEFIQLARPTKSLALYLQQVGRGLRISDAKEKTIFLDNVGLYNRFGFPSSKRTWKHHFEGKYIGNKPDENEDNKTISIDEVEIKRTRHQNLEEGNEHVYLIQTTEEKEYLDKRKKEFIDWISVYHAKNTEAYNIAFKKVYVDGLKLIENNHEVKVPTKNFDLSFLQVFAFYYIDIIEYTTQLNELLNTKNYYFFDSKTKKGEFRKCEDYDELLLKINENLQNERVKLFNKVFKDLIRKYMNLDFKDSELEDIKHEILECKSEISANISNSNILIWILFNLVYYDNVFITNSKAIAKIV